ncbi:PREDICTED: uncharacterized protein LOC108529292 isoform X1 [Rhinopithecus bieti]|uniref:uncharacterized protein LOC108529292 isoform X1 n=1 Tax=Rhinopithecus bieti TaxID=61621 RepID=UPI00083C543D|nr:PREDICTED: uncharacterized protein LOC108529292 isoform X1 [Rhinopithecus bieti]XP_017727019.1 PREDICTED: uncharacterized protein LOC108529292 isoform X1 [Rhinopithecus bieti]
MGSYQPRPETSVPSIYVTARTGPRKHRDHLWLGGSSADHVEGSAAAQQGSGYITSDPGQHIQREQRTRWRPRPRTRNQAPALAALPQPGGAGGGRFCWLWSSKKLHVKVSGFKAKESENSNKMAQLRAVIAHPGGFHGKHKSVTCGGVEAWRAALWRDALGQLAAILGKDNLEKLYFMFANSFNSSNHPTRKKLLSCLFYMEVNRATQKLCHLPKIPGSVRVKADSNTSSLAHTRFA